MAKSKSHIRKVESWEAIALILVEEMYQEWQIGGEKTSTPHYDDSDPRVKTILTSKKNK